MFKGLKNFLGRHTDLIRLFVIVLAAGTFVYNLNIYTEKAKKTAEEVSMRAQKNGSSEIYTNDYRVKPLINQAYLEFTVRKIRKAHDQIKVLMFFAHKSKYPGGSKGPEAIFAALKKALKRGVQVKLLLSREGHRNHRKARQHLKLLEEFKNNNFEGYIYPGPEKLHGKLVLLDQKKALVGAHNWTWSSLRESKEISYYVIGEKPLRKLHRKFNKLWEKAEEFHSEEEEDAA